MSAYTCHYRHADRPAARSVSMAPLEDATPVALAPVINGRGETIAYRCPVCQRAWKLGAMFAIDHIGERGHELLPVCAKARRARMMEALE